MTNLILIKEEINKQIADKEVFGTLLATTFKGLEGTTAKRAMLEGMMRGFTFKDFLEKNVYAIPFKNTYSLVSSIDYARKIGMRSGVVGVSAPTYELDSKNVISCTITVKRKVAEYVGEYSATVYFDEYNTGFNLWKSKPKTMIAKVAEMHALRKACPEELSQVYVEEDLQKETPETDLLDEGVKSKVANAKTLEELKAIYKENEGLGKDFAKLVTAKKDELNAVS
jgi:hypothetical protein